MDKVTVIVPVYNVEKYLSECIESIIAQTYKNLEIILVDDGSTDTSPVICDNYAEKDSRIKVIHKQNGGVSAARNTALDIMTGDYVAFVDGDDMINAHFVECLLDLCLSTDSDISYCGYKTFESGLGINLIEIPKENKIIVAFDGEEALKNYFPGWIYPAVWNKLYRNNCFDELRFPLVKRAEDMLMTFELLFSGFKISGMKGYPLYYYRSNISGAMSKKINYSAIEDLNVRMNIFKRFDRHQNVDNLTKSFSENTKNILIDTIIRIDFSDRELKPIINDLKLIAKELRKEMFLPNADSFADKFDCFVMNISLRIYRIYKLVQAKIFKVQIYKY